MQYFKVNDDTYLKYDVDNKSVEIISRNALQELSDKLTKELPQVPSDKELLTWAKANYPGLDSAGDTQKRLDEVNAQLAELDKIQ